MCDAGHKVDDSHWRKVLKETLDKHEQSIYTSDRCFDILG